MKIAVLPEEEEFRLADLFSYELIHSEPEQEYDDLVHLAAQICGCPISLLSLVDADKQWFKAKVNFEANETSRSISFCSHTILTPETFIVEDTHADERFRDNPLVTDQGIRFYAGAPIVSPAGHRLGALCVIDHKPGTLNAFQLQALKILSRQVTKLIELRCRQKLLRQRANDIITWSADTLQASIVSNENKQSHVATELHEQVAQKVAACKLALDSVVPATGDQQSLLGELHQQMTDIINDLRGISRSLMPPGLNALPFRAMVDELLQQYREKYHYRVSFSYKERTKEKIEYQFQQAYHIIKDWMDTLGSRKARHAGIAVTLNKNEFSLIIKDDMVHDTPQSSEKIVMTSLVHSRVHLGGGTLSYERVRDGLNTLSISLPVQHKMEQLMSVA